MKFIKENKITILLIIFGLLIIFAQLVVNTTVTNNFDNLDKDIIHNNTRSGLKNYDLQEFDGIYISDNFQDGSCGECHENFNPFDVELDYTEELDPKQAWNIFATPTIAFL